MLKVHIERALAATPQRAWDVLRTFNLAYFKNFPHTITGTGPGAERTFAQPDGEMTERVIALDDAAMTLSYKIVSGPWPVSDYTATICVTPHNAGCQVTWSADFNVTGADPEKTADFVAGTFKMNLRALEKYLAS